MERSWKDLIRTPEAAAAYRESLTAENTYNLPRAAGAAILICLAYQILLRFWPSDDVFGEVGFHSVYARIYWICIAQSVLFLFWNFGLKLANARVTGIIQTFFAALLLLLAAWLTAVDLTHSRDLTAINLTSIAMALFWRAERIRYLFVIGLTPFALLFFGFYYSVPVGADLFLSISFSCTVALIAAFVLESARRRAFLLQMELKEQSTRDILTGLRNRRFLGESLPMFLGSAMRRNAPLCVLLMDIDSFKKINDLFGHAVGDFVLEAVGRELRGAFRAGDLIVRFGGEEFLVLLPDVNLKQAFLVADRIRKQISKMHIPGFNGRITLSGGLAQIQPGEKFEVCLDRADARLYDAKHAGKNRTAM